MQSGFYRHSLVWILGVVFTAETKRKAAANFVLLCRMDSNPQHNTSLIAALRAERYRDEVSESSRHCWFSYSESGRKYQNRLRNRRCNRVRLSIIKYSPA